ncbi:MAG TPA: hypothetical protein DF383_06590 [Deltaproteobacteria bacterium]|nr:hypothetical protein [Deltaproteobacteria bacterium]
MDESSFGDGFFVGVFLRGVDGFGMPQALVKTTRRVNQFFRSCAQKTFDDASYSDKRDAQIKTSEALPQTHQVKCKK